MPDVSGQNIRMKEKLQQIREACIKANPEIVELKFGCEVEHIPFQREIYIGHTEKEIVFKKFSASHPYVFSTHNTKDLIDDMKIIGRPIRLADVIFAVLSLGERIGGQEEYDDVMQVLFYVTNKSEERKWNLLKDDLNLQDEPCIDFLHNILK